MAKIQYKLEHLLTRPVNVLEREHEHLTREETGYPPFNVEPKKRRHYSSGVVILCIACLLVLLGSAAVGIALFTHSQGSDQSLAPLRQQQTSDSIDPGKIILQQPGVSGQGITTQAASVIDGCTLLTEPMIASSGLKLAAQRSIVHSWGGKNLTIDRNATSDGGNALSTCSYPIVTPSYSNIGAASADALPDQNDGPRVALNVNRKSFNADSRVDAYRQPPVGTVPTVAAGITWFEQNDPTALPDTHKIRLVDPAQPDTVYTLSLTLSATDAYPDNPKSVVAKLANQVAGEIAKHGYRQAHFSYSSAYQNMPEACDLASADIANQVAGAQTWDWASSAISQHEGVATYAGSTVSYVDQTCERLATSPQTNASLTKTPTTINVEFKTFRTTDEAQKADRFLCQSGDFRDLNAKIGDVTPCVSLGTNALLRFTSGRVAVTVVVSAVPSDASDYLTDNLVPAAQALATKIHY